MSAETPLLPTSDSGYRIRQRHRDRVNWHNVLRLVLPALVVVVFLVFIFIAGILNETRRRLPREEQPDFPDFSHYKYLDTLPHTYFPKYPDDDRRVVAVGDIHGMNESLSALLDKVSYNPRRDTLIHTGDLVPKRKWISSEPVLSFMSTNHILGVRGNNDQKVIEWRAWMDWIMTIPGGKEWLEDMDADLFYVDGDESSPDFDIWFKKSHKRWKNYVPEGWKLQGKHYKAAREMSQEHYDYLLSLPLLLYAPTAHTYFVHAGLLAADPTLETTDPRQPLSHLPTTDNPDVDELTLRGLQELALLNEVPQNQDPWTLLNMRSLTEDDEITDSNRGTPWSDLWNDVMSSCSGFPAKELSTNPSKHHLKTHASLECFPSMVVYGHAAARGLDVKRWSVGLDSNCARGRRLTAVILDANTLPTHTRSGIVGVSSKDYPIPYGDEGTAQIVSVRCDA